ncbi:MAG: hypothetical protein PHG48_06120, partial [Eubacteriales bacterium]|nr:hypothetical protein [Eubacteriales bacterium]
GPGASSGGQSSSSSQTSVSGIPTQPDPGNTEGSSATSGDIFSQAGSLGSVFRTYTDTQIELFGVSCHLLVYNLADYSTGTDQNEHTYVVITIPSYSNRTFYNIEFKIPKGRLVPDTIYSVNRLVKSMIVSTLPLQKTDPGILSDPLIVIPAAAGVFPDLINSSLSYVTLIDNRQGISIDLPESAVPYHMNSLAGNYNYRSYRLSKTAFISVTILPAHNTAAEKIDLLRKLYSGRLTINEMSDKTVSGNIFSYLHYELSSAPEISTEDNTGLLLSGTLGAPSPAAAGPISSEPGKTTVYDYYIGNRDSLINIRLTSENTQPSASEKQVFEKVVSSLNFIPVVSDDGTYSPSSYRSLSALQGFTGGYDLLIPSGWDAAPLPSSSSGSAYAISSDSFTASTEVVVFESEISEGIPVSSIRSYLSGPANKPCDDLLRDYRSPLAGKNAVLLDSMAYQINSLHYIVKLTGFIDDSGRSRLAYTMDIIKDDKVSTLFISVNDYAAEASGGSPENGILRHSLYAIINSFDAAYAPGDPDSGSDKSTLEESADKFINSQFGINAAISSMYASRTVPGEFYINVANTGSSSTSGFYRLKITSDGQVRIVSMMSIKDAVGNAVAEITGRYRNSEISGITYNVTEAGSISLEMIFRKDGLYEKRLYSVNIDLTGSAPKTGIIRKASYDSLIES